MADPTSTRQQAAPTARAPDDVVPRSVGRVLDLFEAVLAAGSCSLTTAALAVELTPTTALRHLRALQARGYVDRDDAGMFSAGPTIFRIATGLLESGPARRLIETAQPFLDGLADETGESTYLAMCDGSAVSYVARSESKRSIRHVGWVGQIVPLEGTAVGAAFENPGVVTTRTGAVESDITASSIALPPIGSIRLALSVVGPEQRFDRRNKKAIEQALQQSVLALLAALGHRGGSEG